MSIQVGSYSFNGPYWSTSYLRNAAGVYVILCTVGGGHQLLDVGEAADVRDRIENHDRAPCWNRNCFLGTVLCAAYYTPLRNPAGRREIEQAIRDQFNVPCGET